MKDKLFLHEHEDFREICDRARDMTKASLQIVEKDYWLMHIIWSLGQSGHKFELKGGTSLSKAWKIISRFSEDVDIHIHPPSGMQVYSGKNHDRPNHISSRDNFYNWLPNNIKVSGAISITRKPEWDDAKIKNCGIAISYPSNYALIESIKPYILLEVGFAKVDPNQLLSISSWVFDIAFNAGLDVVDNRAIDVPCYLPQYTFVEKLSAIAGKYKQEQEGKIMPVNFIRHYYDIHQLLKNDEVIGFIGTEEYNEIKESRFSKSDDLSKNEAFILSDKATRKKYEEQYLRTKALYYDDFPSFDQIMDVIGAYVNSL